MILRLVLLCVLFGISAMDARAQAGAGEVRANRWVAPTGAGGDGDARDRPALVFRHGVRPHASPNLYTYPGTAGSDTLLNAPDSDPWLAFDKAQHLAFSFLWTLGTQYTLVNKAALSEGAALPLSVAASAAVGIAKEVYDARSGRGVASRRDLVADGVGIILATGLILL